MTIRREIFLQYGVSYNLTSNIFITKILGRLDVLFQSGKFSLRQSRGLGSVN